MKVFSGGSTLWRKWRRTNKIAKRVCEGEWPDSRSVGRLWKKGIDIVRDRLKKRCLEATQARLIVHDRSVWWGSVSGNAWDIAWGMNP